MGTNTQFIILKILCVITWSELGQRCLGSKHDSDSIHSFDIYNILRVWGLTLWSCLVILAQAIITIFKWFILSQWLISWMFHYLHLLDWALFKNILDQFNKVVFYWVVEHFAVCENFQSLFINIWLFVYLVESRKWLGVDLVVNCLKIIENLWYYGTWKLTNNLMDVYVFCVLQAISFWLCRTGRSGEDWYGKTSRQTSSWYCEEEEKERRYNKGIIGVVFFHCYCITVGM